MKYIHSIYLILLGIIALISACSIPDVEPALIEEEPLTNSIEIPDGFDFSTHHKVKITINDNASYVKYDVYAYSDETYNFVTETFENESGEIVTQDVPKNDFLNKLVFSGVPYNGVLSQTISLSKNYNKVYIIRNENLNFSSSIETINNQEVTYDYSIKGAKNIFFKSNSVTDYLFCVNGAGELFQVNPLNGELTLLSVMPMGSYTAAIDQEHKTLYSIGRSSPYPLMKYSISNNTWETVANLGIGGPRLGFNKTDGLLYFSKKDKLYTFDPITGVNLSTWNIIGLHNVNGGDLAFADDGTLFLCSFSGLYKLEIDSENQYQSTRISADNLPFQPTSMTFDSNQELWLANNANSSDLIIMDTQTGGWIYKYGISAENSTDLGRTINDLSTFKIYDTSKEDLDSDGDGIKDNDDSYPDNPDKAFEIFTPSKYGTGTIAFEDLWPSTGDYDFNDVALNYQAIAVLNAQNLAVQIDFICNVKSNGAGYQNGIGIEMEGIAPSQIESITGPVYTHNYINRNINGTEANQENAVVILCDDVDNILNKTTISIKFTNPISTDELGVVPFNPFIIVNASREKEVHLPYKKATSLGVKSAEIAGVNSDPNGNYISNSGFPWAISVIHDFKVPKERTPVNAAYNHFNQWAMSGGKDFKDWYKDNPGYRNQDKIDQ